MNFKDLSIGTIFFVPSMPQWGIMMKSWIRTDKGSVVFVSLTGNCWTHLTNPMLDDELQVIPLPELKFVIDHLNSSITLKQ